MREDNTMKRTERRRDCGKFYEMTVRLNDNTGIPEPRCVRGWATSPDDAEERALRALEARGDDPGRLRDVVEVTPGASR